MENKQINLRTLNKLIKDENTEITRFKGAYYYLHICHNGNPVPLFHSKSAKEMKNYIAKMGWK